MSARGIIDLYSFEDDRNRTIAINLGRYEKQSLKTKVYGNNSRSLEQLTGNIQQEKAAVMETTYRAGIYIISVAIYRKAENITNTPYFLPLILFLRRLDILVNNAGVVHIGPEKSEDGILVAMQTNYFGHFLLTNLLLDLLKNTVNSRIVNVSSISASFYNLDINVLNSFPKSFTWNDLKLYGRSKLCQILFTIELAKRLSDTKVTVYALHPGIIPTEIWRGVPYILREPWMKIQRFFCKDILEGTQTIIYCSVAKEIERFSGQLFEECHVSKGYRTARNPNLPKKLWEISEELVQLK